MITFTIPMRLSSPSNGQHGHWTKHASVRKRQRQAIAAVWRTLRGPSHEPPFVVTLTRVAPRALDTDNLAAAFKSIRDEVAARLGYGDSPTDPIEWVYRQEKSKPGAYFVRVDIEEKTK